jgi:hypothetical protein
MKVYLTMEFLLFHLIILPKYEEILRQLSQIEYGCAGANPEGKHISGNRGEKKIMQSRRAYMHAKSHIKLCTYMR